MARMRTIKPEVFRSLTVSAWPVGVRWTFAGLLTYLDDAGRGHDDLRLIRAEIYPVDDGMTPAKVGQHLDVIASDGPLCRYQVDGGRYLHMTRWLTTKETRAAAAEWSQHIPRPTPSRLPPCPIHEVSASHQGVLAESSQCPHGEDTESATSHHGPRTEASFPPARPRDASAGRVPRDASADQGSGIRDQGSGIVAAPPPQDAPPINAGSVVQAWTDAITAGGTRPTNGMRGQVGKLAKELLQSGNPPDRVLAAARQAGRAGYATIDRELAAMYGRRGGSSGGTDPTTGRRWE